MQIRKFCLCGCKLERQASDEDTARQVVMAWRLEHTGEGHGPADKSAYKRALAKIIAKCARPKAPDDFFRAPKPGELRFERMRFERIQMENPVPHEWGCNCADCRWMIEAITAQDDAGGYLFTKEELQMFADESNHRGPIK